MMAITHKDTRVQDYQDFLNPSRPFFNGSTTITAKHFYIGGLMEHHFLVKATYYDNRKVINYP